ncbi:unnamed protein product [Rhizoctonia solani]|uniref:Uncharacterized protein n=1 Tax=Rhizoctonia solani TaxID=456999 RepID=A0A8H3BS43_9AGAM|nr:unnamed protein product [Rhizoctonia solani]
MSPPRSFQGACHRILDRRELERVSRHLPGHITGIIRRRKVLATIPHFHKGLGNMRLRLSVNPGVPPPPPSGAYAPTLNQSYPPPPTEWASAAWRCASNGTPTAPPAKAAPKAPKYPPGDREYIPDSDRIIFVLSEHLRRLKQNTPVYSRPLPICEVLTDFQPQQKRMVDDIERRLNVIFDTLN